MEPRFSIYADRKSDTCVSVGILRGDLKCHNEGSANSFIVFMLEKISETLYLYLQQASSADAQVSEYVRRLLNAMEYDVPYTAKRIMELLNLKSKETLRRHYINPALEMGLIVMSMPDKPTSRNQAYVKK